MASKQAKQFYVIVEQPNHVQFPVANAPFASGQSLVPRMLTAFLVEEQEDTPIDETVGETVMKYAQPGAVIAVLDASKAQVSRLAPKLGDHDVLPGYVGTVER